MWRWGLQKPEKVKSEEMNPQLDPNLQALSWGSLLFLEVHLSTCILTKDEFLTLNSLPGLNSESRVGRWRFSNFLGYWSCEKTFESFSPLNSRQRRHRRRCENSRTCSAGRE